MITWTDSAKEVVEDYCRRTRENLRGTGADPDEVADDLRRHVEEEVRAAKLTVVTEEEVRRILARVGETTTAKSPAPPASPDTTANPQPAKRPSYGFIVAALLFGVVLPAGTFVFELMTGASAGLLFDPLPNWFQIAAVALVPIVNLWLGIIAIKGKTSVPNFIGWLSGIAAGICCFYSILYLPIAPFAGIAIIYFGIGLVPLSPFLAWIFVLALRASVNRRLGFPLNNLWRGFGLALAALVLWQVPTGLTYYGMATATSEEASAKARGISTLRLFGDNEMMLRECYFGSGGAEVWPFDLVRFISSGSQQVSQQQAQEIYFRVTGKPFNSVPLPSLYRRFGRWEGMDQEFSWDDALGGESVAGRVKGLSLLNSRLDAVADPNAASVYCEWTMEFKNVSQQQREARAQIALPPGGVVSRLTLWVNGEEREAAFGGRSDVRAAYQQVAVVQRHDPVLVTTCGPDRVLVQCFPVPPNGGTMKVRVGITSPLVLETEARGHFLWPKFIERNFALAPDFKYAVWIDSSQKISAAGKALVTSNSTGKISVHGTLSPAEVGDVIVERAPEIRDVWSPALETNQIIHQRIAQAIPPRVGPVILVIDGSAGMADERRELVQELGKLPSGIEVQTIIANDNPVKLNPSPAPATEALLKELSHGVQSASFTGGCDNLPALVEAWDAASASDSGVVIWIHDTQPMLLSSTDNLLQRIERSGHTVPIYDLQIHSGPNRIAEKLDGMNFFKRVPEYGMSPGADLENLFRTLDGKTAQCQIIRGKVAEDFTGDRGLRVGRDIERLWARDETRHLTKTQRRDDAIKLAAKQQLVTPVTGAVVLETKAQYAENGLEPVPAESVPMIPEPQTFTLWIIGGLCAWWRWRKRTAAMAKPGGSAPTFK